MEQSTKKAEDHSRRYGFVPMCICFVAAILAVYWLVYSYDFVKYDDQVYVTNNANIQSGLNWKSICWAFTTGYASNWHPVTWLSHILDYQLFGSRAGGHHLTNILFHILNTIVLFYVLMRMTGAIWPSAFVAAVFALHPLHVESVAWVAERKDLLSTFFWLLTMWAYVRYVENPRLWRYLTAFVLFVLGLMSKPMLVTVPFVLFLLDYWPLGRKFSRLLLIEKIPFFMCSFASCVVTFLIQQSSGVVAAANVLRPEIKINNAIVSYIAYIIKMIWPSRLAVFYPHPADVIGLSTIRVTISAFVLLLLSICFICLARRHRFFAVGWLWYLGTLAPVIGLIQVGMQAMADRYTYMTLTGLFIIIAWSAKEFVPRWRYKNIALAFSAVAALVVLSLISRQQLKYWKNSSALFEHTLRVTKNNYNTFSNYANYLCDSGKFDEAIELFNKALIIKPYSATIHSNLGGALLRTGKLQQAAEQFELAIKYKPDFSPAYCNLADVLRRQGRPGEAISYYKQAVKIKPDYVGANLSLAVIFNELKKFDEVIESCNKVLEFDRNNVTAHGYLGLALAAAGKTDEAIKEIRFVLNIRPNDIEMHRNLGILLERKGETAEAIEAYRAALRIDPNEAGVRQLLEAALEKQQAP